VDRSQDPPADQTATGRTDPDRWQLPDEL